MLFRLRVKSSLQLRFFWINSFLLDAIAPATGIEDGFRNGPDGLKTDTARSDTRPVRVVTMELPEEDLGQTCFSCSNFCLAA